MNAKDHVLVTIVDWDQRIFRLEREEFQAQQPERMMERNQQVAYILYQALEQARREDIFLREAVPTLYSLLPDKQGYPPDHWDYVIHQDGRMETGGMFIRYRESLSPLDDMLDIPLSGGEVADITAPQLSQQALQQIYRIRAAFKDQQSIWRDIEIQGAQTLDDLDGELRGAFNHDYSDHLSGFWLLIPRAGRGKKKRY